MPRSVTCILNNQAGPREKSGAREHIERLAAEHGRDVKIVMFDGGDLASLARKAGESGGIVAAGGGDGTISTVAAALVDSEAALGVLPMGTLNHFAKDVKIPPGLEEALSVLFTGVETRVDVGEVNGRIFINNSSVGFYPQIVREREQQQRRGLPKWLAFAHAVARVGRRGTTMHVRLEDDRGGSHVIETSFVFVGNNPYHISGLEIGTRERLDGGELWLCTAPQANRAKILGLALGALFGRVDKRSLLSREVKTVQIQTRRGHELVARDGEVGLMPTPLLYRIRAGALRVIVPQAA